MRLVKKKAVLISVIISACLLLAVGIGVTVAYLVSQSQTLDNTFTSGNVSVTLTESRSDGYLILPGTDVPKDPTVTVEGGSEACWLFFKAEASNDFDKYMTYTPDDGWTPLEGIAGVYYRQVDSAKEDISFSILKSNAVSVRDTVTEEDLDLIRIKPTLTFTAYAIQQVEINSAEEAWNHLKEEQLNETA